MPTFRIRNAISKGTLGVFEAGTTAQALDQLAQAGGWNGFAALTREVPLAAGGVIVEKLAQGAWAPEAMPESIPAEGHQVNAQPTAHSVATSARVRAPVDYAAEFVPLTVLYGAN